MAKQTTIDKEDLLTVDKAAETLNVSKAQVCKYVKQSLIRRVKDRTDKSKSYIYAPDVEAFLSSRFYFEGEE